MRNSTKRIFTRSLSGFLTLITLIGVLASLSIIPVFAADESVDDDISYSERWNNYYTDPTKSDADFTSEEKRLNAMQYYYSNANFELYVDKITGEVAIKDKTTEDILFTNPYDIAEYPTSGSNYIGKKTKQELLSQIKINYTEKNATDAGAPSYNSFTDSALLGQIKIKRLNGGVRVEYSIGEEATRTLVPQLISVTRFDEMIRGQLESNLPRNENGEFVSTIYERITKAWYTKYDPNDPGLSQSNIDKMHKDYPITKKMAVYALASDINNREIKLVETWIKQYCPEYTFEELDKDHKETEYVEKKLTIANFKLALEYYLTDNGVEVRFPANGLTFDETNFGLESIEILEQMGAGNTYYNGYTFIPDGSGSITRFEDVLTNNVEQDGKVYGEDYAYQNVSGQNEQIFRLPVFGVVTSGELQTGIDQNTLVSEKRDHSTGYFAVITEGDALATITAVNGGSFYNYGSVYCSINPRPKDSYSLGDVISVAGNKQYTVVSDRKYTDSFRINYIMLTSEDYLDTLDTEKVAAAKANGRKFYDTTYMGMAKAYREYLEDKGDIQKITSADENIPLYIEVFGSTETEESVLSIPVTVKKPLTTFEDLEKMTDELSLAKSPITNINYRLTGFTNGGMVSTVPAKVKFEKVVGGNSGFRDFLDYANEKGIGVYPEFDFAYMEDTAAFDGFSYKRDAVKTIDNRYTTKRVYDAVLQSFVKTDKICISPGVYRDFFEKFNKSMTKVLDGRSTGVSVGTLGSDLNSDFDEDEPYNREDSKGFTEEMLAQLKKNYGNVLIEGGNAYAIKYASVILNAPLDSSRFLSSSNAIPFFGLVFHGYVEFAGAPTNMAGDIKYETLKIIENGATLYMMLSYQNVELLKEDEELSQYYAINYEIWKQTLLSQYSETGELEAEGLYDKINKALRDVQTSLISDHRFIECNRKLTDKELADITTDATVLYEESVADAKSVIAKYQAMLDLYDRIVAEYEGEERDELLAGYGLDKALIEMLKSQAEQILAEIEEKGISEYIQNAANNIDLYIDDGSVVYVEYENGHYFILNYNIYTVEVVLENGETVEIEPKDFYDSKANA